MRVPLWVSLCVRGWGIFIVVSNNIIVNKTNKSKSIFIFVLNRSHGHSIGDKIGQFYHIFKSIKNRIQFLNYINLLYLFIILFFCTYFLLITVILPFVYPSKAEYIAHN